MLDQSKTPTFWKKFAWFCCRY